MTQPLAIDLFCGLGGWTDGLLAEGYYTVGFDVERHDYGTGGYPAQLVLQDVLSIHGKQFKDAALIVASPPCQEFSYMAMPWSRAKAKEHDLLEGRDDPKRLTALFDACFRIQREASEAAGRHIPMVVENVRGAQKWVGRARWNFGSFYLWGDVPALMPMTKKAAKVPGLNWNGSDKPGYVAKAFNGTAEQRLREGAKNSGGSWFVVDACGNATVPNNARDELAGCGQEDISGRKGIPHRSTGHWTNPAENSAEGLKGFAVRLGEPEHAKTGSKSKARKAASAMIAKIPLTLSRYIAAHYKPTEAA